MKSTSIRRAIVPGIAVLTLALSACGAGNDDSDETATDGSSSASTGGESLSGDLNGGGSSAQTAAQQAWAAGFQGANSGATVNYDPVGSGTGRENFISGAFSFAGSDSALSDDESEGDSEIAQAKATCGADAIEVPAYVSAIAVVYNLPGVDELQLSPALIAQIFNGKVTTWNDPAIAEENPDADLPDTTITPVHRSDDSGTTKNFTDYLEQTAATDWTYPSDDTWPVAGGEAAEGTSGVVSSVTAGEGAIGYADESQAGGLSIAKIKVGDEYVAPSSEGAAAILASSPRTEGRADTDMAIDIDRTSEDPSTYPLILASYLIACPSYDDANTAALVKGYLTYVVSEEGQAAAAETAGSAPLDSELSSEASDIISAIK